jgi:hypothetical protein
LEGKTKKDGVQYYFQIEVSFPEIGLKRTRQLGKFVPAGCLETQQSLFVAWKPLVNPRLDCSFHQ